MCIHCITILWFSLLHLCTPLLLGRQISVFDIPPLQSRSRNIDVISPVKRSFRWAELPVLACLNNKQKNHNKSKTRRQKCMFFITYSWQELFSNLCYILDVHVHPPNLQLGVSANIHTVIMLNTEGQHIWMSLSCLCAYFFCIWLFFCFFNLLKHSGWVTKILKIFAWWGFYMQAIGHSFHLNFCHCCVTAVFKRVLWYEVVIRSLAKMWLGSVGVWQLARNLTEAFITGMYTFRLIIKSFLWGESSCHVT